MADYEIKTMKKDLEEIEKKSSVAEPPEELPVAPGWVSSDSLPGAPLPSEPIVSAEEPKQPLPQVPKPPIIEIKEEKEIEELPRQRTKGLLASIIVVLVLVGGFYYWWNYLRVSQKTEPEIPVSLISVDTTDVIEIKTFDENILIEGLQTSFIQKENEGSLRRILIKKIEKKQDYFVSLEKLCEVLGIKVPTDVSGNFEKDYTLFFYSQKQGNRIGLITKIVNVDALKVSLGNWENSMRQDLEPIFLGQQLGQPATSI
ncbi:hypothetical protein MUP06_01115, partial [Patescibacteria group bacterium]|nr:hypothetical protein [Patescibacteria group bacterium]